jgi:hypothetical protein
VTISSLFLDSDFEYYALGAVKENEKLILIYFFLSKYVGLYQMFLMNLVESPL